MRRLLINGWPHAARIPRGDPAAWLSALVFLLCFSAIEVRAEGFLELQGRVIDRVEVQSPIPFTESDLNQTLAIKAGDLFDLDAIRRSLVSLYQTGRFRNIRVETLEGERGVHLIYHLIPTVYLQEIRLLGNKQLSTPSLLEALAIRIGEEWLPERLTLVEERLQTFSQREGYFRSSVKASDETDVAAQKVVLNIAIHDGDPAVVSRLELKGETAYSRKELLGRFKTKVGKRYRANRIEEDLKALEDWYVKQGYVQVALGSPHITYDNEKNSVRVEITIQAGPRVQVFFQGNRRISKKALEAELLIQSERSVDEGLLRDSADRLRDLYRKRGYPFATVTFQREETQPGEIRILFNIEEGPRARLQRITFEGNNTIPSGKLRRLMQTRESGFFSRGIFLKENLEQDIKGIERNYQERGFLQTRVVWELTHNPERTALFLHLKIGEGVQTMVQGVHYEGNQAILTETLIRLSKLRSGIPFNPFQLREDLRSILSLYSQRGYVYAKIDQETNFQDDRRQVDLTYRIAEDQPAYLGNIVLKGNNYTRDRVLLRELLVRRGDPYDYEKILKSTQRLYRLGYFSEVRFEPENPEAKEYIRNMGLTVKERDTGAVEFGGGYGEEEGARGFVQIAQNNLYGTGRRVVLRGEGSLRETKYTLNFTEPWLFGYNMDARLGFIYQTQQRTSYKLQTYGATVGVERSFSDTIKGSFFYQFERNRTDVESVDLSQVEPGRLNIGSINPSLIWDSRDDPFNPTSGSIHGILFRDAALILGSEVQFFKTTLQSSWYLPLTRWAVLALSGKSGFARKFGRSTEVPITERFFLGGRSTVRGYQQDSLSPRLLDGTLVGGNAMVNLNSELRFSLPFRLGLVLFLDSGNVWERFQEVDLTHLKSSIGSGIRYNTPVGPLRLDYGYKLHPHGGESLYEIHFTLGQAF